MMKSLVSLVLLAALCIPASAQQKKALEEMERLSLRYGAAGIQDRAGGTHNKSNIGEFFENRGKLYARTRAQGPSGEFPIGSGREYIYRINPFVGIPGNVIQGRYTQNEEWEAAAGYHNRDSAKIAFSDKPYTWPASGWPVKDAAGNPIFISDQDSYCVYNDSNNTRQVLGIEVHQTGYAFGLKLVKDMIFFIYDIVNKSPNTYTDLYFGMYVDLDIGNMPGGVNEYGDDRLGINRELRLLYFYDSDNFSSEWPGGPPGYFGYAFLKTPTVNGTEVGWTDFHYNVYDDDLDRDSVQYGIMSSAASLLNSSLGPRYFHLGSNAPNRHFDDTATVPLTGLDLVANMSSGPYTLRPGDTLRFVTVMVAGNTLSEIVRNTQRAYDLMAAGFSSPRPPEPAPTISVIAGDRKVYISWDDAAERSRDQLTGRYDFEGYRLYKSVDLGQHWDQIDRNQQPNVGPDPVPLAQFDKINGIGDDTGLQYSYIDSNVVNGLEYWYSITAYDSGDSLVASLENPRGNSPEARNLGIAIPRTNAAGRTPVSSSPVTQSGSGVSNVVFAVQPNDVPEAADRSYTMMFEPMVTIENGNLRTVAQVTVASHQAATANTFSIRFLSPTSYRLRDLTSGTVLVANGAYTSGTPISFAGLTLTLTDTSAFPDQRPEAGDSLLIRPGIRITSSSTEVMPLRPLAYNTRLATTNKVVVSISPIEPIQSIQQVAGTNPLTVRATVTNASLVPDGPFRLSVISAFGDSIRYLGVELRNATDSLITRRDSLQSGGSIAGIGFTLQISFEASRMPTVGTTVTISTVKRRMITYQDAFTFTTFGARVDNAAAARALENVKVVPNPYLLSSLYEREFGALRREPIRQIKFNNLPPKCTIYIFTLAGDKVQTVYHDSDNGTATWDLRGAGGREIAPGIYLYLVKTENAEKLGRFAVIK
jgi:hypothetical protein